jgi:hypothetical protein
MDLLKAYIAGLNAVIAAGVDVQTVIHGTSHPIIRAIEILPELRLLRVWYLDKGYDKRTYIDASSKFTVHFNDFPNEMREAGWQ